MEVEGRRFFYRKKIDHKLIGSVSGIFVTVAAFSACVILSLVVLFSAFNLSPVDIKMSTYNLNRTELYERMAGDFSKNGAAFLSGGETSQTLKLSDIFTLKDGRVLPVHKPAEPPVRAAILYLPAQYSEKLSQTVKEVFGPHFSGVWYQDPHLYHFSMFHASHHLESVIASAEEVEAEIQAVKDVAKTCCPLHIQLERVVLTSTGVLIGCWQVLEGTDPVVIRSKLKNSLRNAPTKQLYDPEILHTSFARILPPGNDTLKVHEEMTSSILEGLVLQLNKQLQNFEATVKELWFVEELDILALALNGRMKAHKFPLGCSPK